MVGTDLADGTPTDWKWQDDRSRLSAAIRDFVNHINSNGQAVGHSSDCHGNNLYAVLWENGSIIDLNSQVLPGSGFTYVEPVVINDRGEILGNGILLNGDMHAVVLKPDGDCDESCERKLTTTASNAGGTFKQNSATALRESPVLTPLERVRSMMRQRYHLPGQPAAPRD